MYFCFLLVLWENGPGCGHFESFGKEGRSTVNRGTGGRKHLSHAAPSPLFQKCSVHCKSQHGTHRGTEARSQPEGGVLQVCLSHVPVRGSTRWRTGEGEKTEHYKRQALFFFFFSTIQDVFQMTRDSCGHLVESP